LHFIVKLGLGDLLLFLKHIVRIKMTSRCFSNASISFDALYRPGSVIPGCQPQLKPVVDFSFITLGCSSRMRRDKLRTSGLFITSTNYDSWTSSRAVGFKYTPLYSQLPSPLVFYHESSMIASSYPLPLPNATDLSTLCMVDLFDAWPSFTRLVASKRSCIDAFYRIAGRREPFEGVLRIPSGKVLSRKVAALYHASMGVDDGTPMMWLDWDTTYRPQPHNVISSFWQHVIAHDVTVLPFRHPDRSLMRCSNVLTSLDDPSHTIDTGLLGLRRGAVSVKFLWRLMRHYDGGATYLRHICACCDQTTFINAVCSSDFLRTTPQIGIRENAVRQSPKLSLLLPCREVWFTHNLFLDDLFVWTLHVLWERRADRHVHIGWFGTGKTHVHGINLGQCTWKGQPWISACTDANEVTSSFDVQSIFRHFVASFGDAAGPYTKVSRQKVQMPTQSYLQFDPQVRIDATFRPQCDVH